MRANEWAKGCAIEFLKEFFLNLKIQKLRKKYFHEKILKFNQKLNLKNSTQFHTL